MAVGGGPHTSSDALRGAPHLTPQLVQPDRLAHVPMPVVALAASRHASVEGRTGGSAKLAALLMECKQMV